MEKHHATLLFASSLEESSLPLQYKTQSADVLHFTAARFSIDDARELSLRAQQHSFGGTERVFVIVADDIAIEAQNALLKLLEEPPSAARFFIVLKHTATLIPTLLSRLSVERNDGLPNAQNETFLLFASLSYAQRLEHIAAKTKEKDTQWIEEILRGFEMWTQESKEKSQGRKTALFIRTYIHTKGASAKMLLEEMALTLPLL